MNTAHMVFVFGSNLSGIHGAGAAAYAHKRYSIPYGYGEGFYDGGPEKLSYALPTKGFYISNENLDFVSHHVDKFLIFAYGKPHLDFKITQVGCGLGGYTKSEIAPLFSKAPINCFFDEAWEPVLGNNFSYWGTF